MKILDDWISETSHVLIDGAGADSVGFHLAVERKLSAIGDPEIAWGMDSGETGFIRALLGKRRDLLVVRHERFPEYQILYVARGFGTALHASMLVRVAPRFAKDVQRAIKLGKDNGERFEIGSEMDAFDRMDFLGFVAVAKLAFKDAVRLMSQEKSDGDDSHDFED